jgi:glycosyltransferase involved in cell wall biosynthesis
VKVGLNLVFLVDRAGGAGTYAYELLPALLDADPTVRLTAFISRDAPADLRYEPWAGEVDWVELPVRFGNRSHLFGQVLGIPAVAARRRLDLVHSLANGGPPLTLGARKVVTLLDLIWLHQGEQWDSARAVRSMEVFVRVSARVAHRLITISHAARHDLVSTLGLDPRKIDVAPLGVRPPTVAAADPSAIRERLKLGEAPVVLCVAQKRPYKNLGALIRALPDLETEGAILVLPGSETEHERELRRLADDLGVSDRVRFLDWVSGEDLEALYRTATCFVLPSLVEGFGLPVLEAMARDVPVACSDRPALPEVAGDAALIFDALDQAAVNEAIRRLIRDPELRARLIERGRERVRQFSWRRTAEETLASYRRTLGG